MSAHFLLNLLNELGKRNKIACRAFDLLWPLSIHVFKGPS